MQVFLKISKNKSLCIRTVVRYTALNNFVKGNFIYSIVTLAKAPAGDCHRSSDTKNCITESISSKTFCYTSNFRHSNAILAILFLFTCFEIVDLSSAFSSTTLKCK